MHIISPQTTDNTTMRIPTLMLIKNDKTSVKIGTKKACELSGSICATAICVLAALSSIVFLIYPEEFRSKNLKLESVSPSIPLFLRFVSRRNANLCDTIPDVRYRAALTHRKTTILTEYTPAFS